MKKYPNSPCFASIACSAACLVLGAGTSQAATIYQSVNSTTDTISWSSAIWGSPAATPVAGNDYVSDGNVTATLRTGAAANGFAFPGDSLTLQNGVNFIVKRNARADYILQSGAKMSAGASRAIQGTVFVASGESTIWDATSFTFTFDAVISGSGSIAIAGTTGSVVIGSASNTFTGNWAVNSGVLSLADNAVMTFVVGGNGVNNSLGGTGTATLSGDFIFDLSGAAAVDGNSWQIVNVSSLTETFAPTFSVQGFTESGDIWTNGSGYTFSEATGVLSYAAVPEPSSCVLLLLGVALQCGLRRSRVRLA